MILSFIKSQSVFFERGETYMNKKKIIVVLVTGAILGFLSFVGAALPTASALPGNQELDRQLLDLLKSKSYGRLDAQMSTLVKNYETDFKRETDVDLAVDVFSRPLPDLEPLLTEWITQWPRSYVAYLARGAYYIRIGGIKRGAKTYKETTQQQIEGMTLYFQKAWKDLDQAYALNPRLLHALCCKMTILMSYKERDQMRLLRNKALEVNPYSVTARWSYINTLLPRWGGSIREMTLEIEAARPYHAKNPALKILEGRVSCEYGDQAFFNDDYPKAIGLYTESLRYGNAYQYNFQRGFAYSYSDQYDLSNKDLDLAIQLRPNSPRAYYVRGFNRGQQGKLEEAIKDLDRALEDNPYDDQVWNSRGLVYLRLGKADLALKSFEKAVALSPNEVQYLRNREKAKNRSGSSTSN
jgi:tetratricopeptide (TPR) repeat protein